MLYHKRGGLRHTNIHYIIQKVPNIVNITYGRDVGYKIEEESFDSKVSMSWSEGAKAMIAKAPSGIIEMAINNVEDFARDNGIDAINEDVVIDQMNSVGMDPNMLS